MTSKELKQLFKEAAREVFQEELKEILLEAIRSPKTIVTENQQWVGPGPQQHNSATYVPPKPVTTSVTPLFKQNLRESYMNILNETAATSFGQKGAFNPAGIDPINGDLPEGEISLGQISGLLNIR